MGAGTRIEIWIPQAAPAEAEAETVTIVEETSAITPPTTQPRRVLVVDDDVLVCTGTVAMLEDLGHTVMEANSGAEALAMLDRVSDIDLVITDQLMPSMTGLELIQHIRERRPLLRVILATGYAELPADAATLPRLSKPFRQEDLARMVSLQTSSIMTDALERTD